VRLEMCNRKSTTETVYMLFFLPSRKFRAATCFRVITELGMARGQAREDARRSDGSLCVRVLEIEHTANDVLGGVLAK
jgi:hypothetical protein